MKTLQNSPFHHPSSIFSLFFLFLPSLADGMVGIGAVVGGRVGGWVGAGTIKEKQGQNKSHNISTQNQLCEFTSKNGHIAVFMAGSIWFPDSDRECADRVQLCLPHWLGSSLNHWPVAAATHRCTDIVRKYCEKVENCWHTTAVQRAERKSTTFTTTPYNLVALSN